MPSTMKGVIFENAGAEPTIEETSIPVPASDQILVKSLYTAMNPVDFMIANYGILIQSWPFGLGADASGIVVQAGQTAQEKYGFKEGDYVCGIVRIAVSKEYSTAREYFLMDAAVTLRKPSDLTTAQACMIGSAYQTAALGLFEGLKVMPPGSREAVISKEEWLLVLGGAGSVGGAVVQLATVCGYRVVATCSAKSFEKVKRYGAASVIDYRTTLDEQLQAVLDATKGNVFKIYDATSADDPALAKAVFREVKAGSKVFTTTNDWSSVGDFEGGSTYEIHLGLMGRPESKEINAAMEKYNPIITSLFESGKLFPQEYEEIGTGGLEDAIKAYKHKGDGRKVIVKIQDE